MKKVFLIVLICFLNIITKAQNNYIRTIEPLVPATTSTAVDGLSIVNEKLVNVGYSDGLGRSVQRIAQRQSASGLDDMVSFSNYDQYGRILKNYPQYAKNVTTITTGQFVTSPISEQATFYQNTANIGNTNFPFSETEFEKSVLQRALKQGGIGADWQLTGTNITQAEYLLNTANEVVKFSLTTTSNTQYSASAMNGTVIEYYPAQTLVKNATIDVNGVRTETFTDMHGRKVCSRVYARASTDGNGNYYTADFTDGTGLLPSAITAVAFTTYYIYNDLGQMIYEVPQNAIKAMGATLTFGDILTTNQTTFIEMIYAFHFDDEGRLIEKHVPATTGATATTPGWHYFVYNKLDQLVLFQDPVQKGTNWTFTKYDGLSRTILTGKFNPNYALAILNGYSKTFE